MRPPARWGAVDRIALLAADDTTLARFGPLTLPRPVLARALGIIEPRVVALDFLFAQPAMTTPSRALRRGAAVADRRGS